MGKGHLRAQVPSKISVISATRKMTKALSVKAGSAGLPIKAKTNRISERIKREPVRMSARYLMINIIAC